jgi:hypothetical protein
MYLYLQKRDLYEGKIGFRTLGSDVILVSGQDEFISNIKSVSRIFRNKT